MCGRFAIATTIGFSERFRVRDPPPDVRERFNVAPGQPVPVLVRDPYAPGPAAATVSVMKWGILPPWQRDAGKYLLINARAETLAEKPFFRGLLAGSRCLVPATGYYEWKKSGKLRDPYYITTKDRSLVAFAGLYLPGKGNEHSTFAIVTTAANDRVALLHDRMPAILPCSGEEAWVGGGALSEEERKCLLSPAPTDLLEAYRVGRTVNSPAYDGPELVVRVA